MSPIDLLGRKEDECLELKRWEVEDEKVLRVVVGMLNARGGEIFLGVEEEGGVAVRIQEVREPERRVRSLLDAILDRVSPPPEDLDVETVEVEARRILRIRVGKAAGGPAPTALRKGPYLGFFRRTGDRQVALGRDELVREPHSPVDRLDEIRKEIDSSFRELEVAAGDGGLFRLLAKPVRAPDAVVPELDWIRKVLEEPSAVGSRPGTFHCLPVWHWAPPEARSRSIRGEGSRPIGWQSGWADPARNHLRVLRDGAVEFRTGIESTLLRPAASGRETVLDPAALVGFTASFFRIAGRLLERAGGIAAYATVAEMAGLPRVRLRPFRHDSVYYSGERDERGGADGSTVRTGLVRIEASKIRDVPDRAARRLLVELYGCFERWPEEIPYWDSGQQRFEIP